MSKKETWEDNMQYVGDHMYYATEYLEAIKEDYPKTASVFQQKSGYDVDDLIDDLTEIMNDFNYYAFHVEDEDDDVEDEEED